MGRSGQSCLVGGVASSGEVGGADSRLYVGDEWADLPSGCGSQLW